MDRGGLASGIGALLWDLLPLYFPLLAPAGAVEIIAHRVVWSLGSCLLILGLTRSWAPLPRCRDAGPAPPGRRIPLSVLGLLQYVAPTMQFALGVLVFREEMPAVRWVGFALVWVALTALTADGVRRLRRSTRLVGPGA